MFLLQQEARSEYAGNTSNSARIQTIINKSELKVKIKLVKKKKKKEEAGFPL